MDETTNAVFLFGDTVVDNGIGTVPCRVELLLNCVIIVVDCFDIGVGANVIQELSGRHPASEHEKVARFFCVVNIKHCDIVNTKLNNALHDQRRVFHHPSPFLN